MTDFRSDYPRFSSYILEAPCSNDIELLMDILTHGEA